MVSTVQFFSNTINTFNSLQENLFKTQSLISADSIAETYQELPNINLVESLRQSISRTERYVSSIETVERRVEATYNSVDNIIDAFDNFRSALTLENSTSGPVNDLTLIANNTLDQIEGSLNSRNEGIFLFSGSKTDQQPIQNLRLNNNYINSTPTANYYRGDGDIASVNISSAINIQYGVTAADDAFKNAIAAINLSKQVETGEATIEQAGALVDEAFDDLISLRSSIANNLKIMSDIKDQYERNIIDLEAQFADVNQPDIIELTIQARSNEATLQAAFQTFARVSQLSLVNVI
jgi:flagellin-like hook-associated protein FlgL